MQFCPIIKVSFYSIRLVLTIWGKEAGRDSYPEFPDVIIPIDDSRSPTERYNSDWKCTMTQFPAFFFTKSKMMTIYVNWPIFSGNQTETFFGPLYFTELFVCFSNEIMCKYRWNYLAFKISKWDEQML